MSKYARRKDENHNAITAAFEKMGCRVMDTSRLGNGAPDAIIGFGGLSMCIEIKDGSKPPSARKLTPAEIKARDTICIRIVQDLNDVESAVKTLRRWHAAIMRDVA